MNLILTLGSLAFCVLLFGFGEYRRTRPLPARRVGLVSWPAIQALAIALAFVLVVHALNLLGLKTGATR